MAGFPLLTAGELTGARLRWRRQVPGGAAAKLCENAELAVSDARYRAPLELGLSSNLFQVQSILLECSLAFACSDDPRYLAPVERCLGAIADEGVRAARLPNEVHRAFVVVGLAVAHELCGAAIDQELLEGTVATIVAELHGASEHEEWGDRVLKRNAWNHTAVAYAAIGCGGLLCRERDARARRWLSDALERVQLFFADGVTDAGMTREGLTYCGFVFRNLAPLLLAARNAGVWDYRCARENPHLERLRRVPDWYAIETFPGGGWLQPINDSYWSPKRAMGGFLPTFGALAPDLTAWVYEALLGARGDASHGRDPGMAASSLFESVLWGPAEEAPGEEAPAEEAPAGVAPAGIPPAATAPAHAGLTLPELLADPVVGYVAERVRTRPWSGFSLNCGEYIGGIHDQSDNGSVTLFAGKVPLLIDSAAANEPVEGSPSSSHGHNVVLIDGRGQLPAGGGAGCSGTILHARRAATASTFSVDMTASYCARRYNPVAHALRHCVYGKRPFTYLLVVDDFARPQGERATFDQLFHTPMPSTRTRMGEAVGMRIEFAGKARELELRPLDDGAVVLEEEDFAQHDKALFNPHLLWRLRREGEGRVVMPTLVLAFREGHAPEVSGEFDARAGEVTLRWQTDEAEGVDVVRFTPGAATAATFTRDGRAPADARELPLASGAGPAPSAGRAAGDEAALRRRRRLRRLSEGMEALGRGGEDGAGAKLMEQLVTLADLDPDDSVLELGCGRGQVATALLHYLRYGSYLGLDTREDAIAWCNDELSPRNPRFRFGRLTPPRALPCRDESLDFIVAGAPAQARLAEFVRVLRDGGTVFLTAGAGDRGLAGRLAELPRLHFAHAARSGAVVLRRGR